LAPFKEPLASFNKHLAHFRLLVQELVAVEAEAEGRREEVTFAMAAVVAGSEQGVMESVLADGSRVWQESGADEIAEGRLCRWTVVRLVSKIERENRRRPQTPKG
jgi:hypothetical protein